MCFADSEAFVLLAARTRGPREGPALGRGSRWLPLTGWMAGARVEAAATVQAREDEAGTRDTSVGWEGGSESLGTAWWWGLRREEVRGHRQPHQGLCKRLDQRQQLVGQWPTPRRAG